MLESAVVHFVGLRLLGSSAVLIVDAVVGVLTLLFLLAMASPLWSRIRVDERVLQVRFGWLAAITVPLDLIGDLQPYHPDVYHPVGLGLDFDTGSATLSLTRSSTSPLVRVELTEEVAGRTQGWRRVRARSIVVSTDDPDRLIQTIRARIPDQR